MNTPVLLSLALSFGAAPARASDSLFQASLQAAAQAVAQTQAAQNQARGGPVGGYPPMRSASGSGSKDGTPTRLVEVESTVELEKAPPQWYLDMVKKRFQDLGEKPPADLRVYHYRYRVGNKGKHEIQVNFSHGEIVHSPFTEIIQGFHLLIPPGHAYEVGFLSISPPSRVLSPMNMGERMEDGQFLYSGGTVYLYYPAQMFSLSERTTNGLLK